MSRLGKLGSRVSNTFGNQFGVSDLLSAKDKRQIREINDDMDKAGSIQISQIAVFGVPRNDWNFYAFRGKTPAQVLQYGPTELTGIANRAKSSSSSSDVKAGEVLTGIAAILAPLTKAGVSIYAASQQRRGAPQLQQPYPLPQPTLRSNTGLIIGLVAVVLLGFMMMMKGKQVPVYGPVYRPGYKKRRKK